MPGTGGPRTRAAGTGSAAKALSALLVVGTALPGAASGDGTGPDVVRQRVVSGGAPYGACADGLRRAAEASVALAPGADAPVVLWQQDVDHPAGGEVTTLAAGLRASEPGLDAGGSCGAGGRPGERAAAPSAVTAADGTTWVVTVVNGPDRSSVVVASRPPGAAWQRQVLAAFDPAVLSTSYLPATVAVDPRDPRRVHVAYVRNHFPAGVLAVHRATSDGGRTWSEEHPMAAGATPAGYDFAEQLVALGGQELLSLSTEVQAADLAGQLPHYLRAGDLTQAPVVVRARRSSDGGVTWSPPLEVLRPANGVVRDGERGSSALRSLVRPSVAVGPDGSVHVAAESVAPDRSSTELLVASSPDGGATWTRATAVRVQGVALAAAIGVDGDGARALSWLDLGEDVPADQALTARWRFSWTRQGGAWTAPQALSPSFDLRPLAPAYVGDQGAVLGLRHGFAIATVVGTGRSGDPTHVVLSRTRAGGGPHRS